MLRLWVVAVGGLRHPGMREAAAVYARRLQQMPNVALQVVEVRQGAGSGRDAEVVRREEGRRLMAVRLPADTCRVALTADGQACTTPQFAEWMGEMSLRDTPVAFFVGGAWGLSGELEAWCHKRLSLSPLTMAHELSRLVLLEQLYRAAAILSGSPYPR